MRELVDFLAVAIAHGEPMGFWHEFLTLRYRPSDGANDGRLVLSRPGGGGPSEEESAAVGKALPLAIERMGGELLWLDVATEQRVVGNDGSDFVTIFTFDLSRPVQGELL